MYSRTVKEKDDATCVMYVTCLLLETKPSSLLLLTDKFMTSQYTDAATCERKKKKRMDAVGYIHA